MLDAYEIQRKILEFWRPLGLVPSGHSVIKEFKEVPLYVKVDGELRKVQAVTSTDNKIILEI